MTKIKNVIAYPKDTVISDMDFVIGSDGDSIAKTTKNFFFGSIRDYLLEGLAPEVGGTLKYTEITNNTGAFTNPADLANSLIPSFTVLQYNIVVFTVNGNRYLLKLQDIAIGSVETPITNDDFITIIGFAKIGDGQGVLKGYNETTKLHEYYSLKSDGNDISIVSDNIVIDPKAGVNLGLGENIYKGLNATTKLHEFRTHVSDTLSITQDGDTIRTELVPDLNNLAFYVNVNSTVPTEDGTELKPFKTLNKALDAFIGTGTWYNPQYKGYKIQLLSYCSLIETGTVDYNGYVNLDINNLDIVGNGFYLGLHANPSVDYYPISTRRMVAAMPKVTTPGQLDYEINLNFSNITFQRTGTNAVVDHLNYSFPISTHINAYPPSQNTSILQIENCTVTNDSNVVTPSATWHIIPNPADAGNPVLLFGETVYASNTESIGVPMVKSEGLNWNKTGFLRLENTRLVNSTGTNLHLVGTTFQMFTDTSLTVSRNNRLRFYDTEIDGVYSPRPGLHSIFATDTRYISIINLKANSTIPTVISTELVPRNLQIGGQEDMLRCVVNTSAYIFKGGTQERYINTCITDGTSGVVFNDFADDFSNNSDVHGRYKVIAPLPVSSLESTVNNSNLTDVKTDPTGTDKSYIKYIRGAGNVINGCPHEYNDFNYVDDATAIAAGLIAGNIYYNTTVGALKRIL